MKNNPTSENNLLQLWFDAFSFKALRACAGLNTREDRKQVARDILRIDGLIVRDQFGEWSYVKSSHLGFLKNLNVKLESIRCY
ncbi:MAG: hypothetical protein WAL30_02185 [Candidatus Aquirickettsiella sp.]